VVFIVHVEGDFCGRARAVVGGATINVSVATPF
jgi:hypothetical protein